MQEERIVDLMDQLTGGKEMFYLTSRSNHFI